MKCNLSGYIAASAALCLLSVPASADIVVTDTFTGTVGSTDIYGGQTTADSSAYCSGVSGACFGGGNLIGAPFSLTITMTVPNGSSFGQIVGADQSTGYPYYFGPNFLTAALTINGLPLAIDPTIAAAYNNGSTTTIGNSSAVLYADSGPNGYMVAPDGTVELTAQAFVWSPVNQGQQLFALNLDVLAPGSTVFGQLGSSNGPNPCGDPNNNGVLCFGAGTTEFTTFDGELLVLDITGVDPAAVPGPIAGAGLPGILAACFSLLALVRRRKARCLEFSIWRSPGALRLFPA
jgi:hypothetical protein